MMTGIALVRSASGTATLFNPPTKGDATIMTVGLEWPSRWTGTATDFVDALEIIPAAWNEDLILRERFALLADTWRSETGMYSVDTKKVAHPAYLKIIGMGYRAIPMILEDLRETGGHWYDALEAILGYDPIEESGPMNLRELRERWLAWGRKEGHIRSE